MNHFRERVVQISKTIQITKLLNHSRSHSAKPPQCSIDLDGDTRATFPYKQRELRNASHCQTKAAASSCLRSMMSDRQDCANRALLKPASARCFMNDARPTGRDDQACFSSLVASDAGRGPRAGVADDARGILATAEAHRSRLSAIDMRIDHDCQQLRGLQITTVSC